jgi:hypothetical protein
LDHISKYNFSNETEMRKMNIWKWNRMRKICYEISGEYIWVEKQIAREAPGRMKEENQELQGTRQ